GSTTQSPATILDRTEFSDSRFERLSGGILAFCELGLVRCRDNRVSDCLQGFLLSPRNLAAANSTARLAFTAAAGTGAAATAGAPPAAASPVQPRGDIVRRFARAADQLSPPPAATPTAISDEAQGVLTANIAARGTAAWSAIAGAGAAGSATVPRDQRTPA